MTATTDPPCNRPTSCAWRQGWLVVSLAAGLCLAGLTAAAADAPASAKSDSVSAAVADSGITATIKSRLMGKPAFTASDIDVSTANGVVTLSGWVSSDEAKAKAQTTAAAVAGVKKVDNALVIGKGDAAKSDSTATMANTERVVSDSWITTKVKSEIAANSLAKGFKVSVKTRHGAVRLTGKLDNQDAVDLVKAIAEKVKGVKRVDALGLTVAAK